MFVCLFVATATAGKRKRKVENRQERKSIKTISSFIPFRSFALMRKRIKWHSKITRSFYFFPAFLVLPFRFVKPTLKK